MATRKVSNYFKIFTNRSQNKIKIYRDLRGANLLSLSFHNNAKRLVTAYLIVSPTLSKEWPYDYALAEP